jgi:hypothetical protein
MSYEALRQRGWARRNVWGILALVPVTALMLGAYLDRGGSTLDSAAKAPGPVTADASGWASFANGRVRLVELAPAKDVRDTTGAFLRLADGVTGWRAVLEYDVPDQKPLAGCQLALIDSQERLFGTGAAELAGARVPDPGCTAEDLSLNRYQAFVFFVTPAGADPAAVRLGLAGQDTFARLDLR